MSQILLSFGFFIFSYLLGSIPFSYLITKIFTKKNVFELGWKKSSASNVIKNIGKLPGILAFLLDVGKGFLVIYLSQKLGLPLFVQVLAGLCAILGHNWSIFVKGKGGRGLATLVGAIIGFSPVFLFIIVIPCIIFTFIWTASIGTILSLLFGIFLGFAFTKWQAPGFLLLISLFPIFIKRLSPIKEIKNINDQKKKRELIENRLLFDQDTVPAFRIKFFKNKL
ncbi:MAG: glycerol-3-phosphate acyltransferase [Candidatus Paceibacterota bacterium]